MNEYLRGWFAYFRICTQRYYASRRQWRNYPGGTRFTRTQIYKWKRQLLENVARAFETEEVGGGDASMREAELLQKIGELTMERDFLSHELGRLR